MYIFNKKLIYKYSIKMIISKTPYRVSFFGGGTDYPTWYKNNKNGGKTICCSINKYSYIVLKNLPNTFDYNYRIRYYQREEVNKISEIKHPTIRNLYKYFDIKEKLDLVHFSDLPAATGIGSSSAFTSGLINAITTMYSYKYSKKKIYNLAIEIEQNFNKENIGSQDQVISTIGGFKLLNFNKNKIMISKMEKYNKNLSKIEDCSLLIYSGIQRESSMVTADVVSKIKKKKDVYNELYNLTTEAGEMLKSDKFNIKKFAELLNFSWEIKKKTSNFITNEKIDDLCKVCIKKGAYGVKLLGAGYGGFILVMGNKKTLEKIKLSLKNHYIFPLKTTFKGTQIIYGKK